MRAPKRQPGMPLRKRTGPTFLDGKLAALGFDTYAKYLASKHWHDTRERYYSDPHTPKECICGRTEGLHLHHMTYLRLGGEWLEDLRPLCSTCHMDVHVLARQGLMDLKLQGYCSDLRRARYARERADARRREGLPPEQMPGRPYDEFAWEANAKQRFQATRDPRVEARKAANRIRAV